LDQLTVAEALPEQATKVLVAIADVDALVKKQTAIDDHARHNTTSVYTAAEIFPMLPERLSTDFTSLNFESERLAIVIEMVIAQIVRFKTRILPSNGSQPCKVGLQQRFRMAGK
jgi:exoribonuclease-2